MKTVTNTNSRSIRSVGIAAGIAGVAMSIAMPAVAADPTFEVSGQVNAAMLFGGDIADPEIVDNNASGTRLRIRASQDAFGSQRAFLRYEIQAQENSSSVADGSESFDTRFAEVGLSGTWGKLSLGKGEGATDNSGEISYITSGNLFGGGHLTLFTVSGTLNRDNAANVGWTYYDGFGRVSRLRYDTPTYFGGLTGAVSLNSGDNKELALRYRGDVGPGKLFANFGLADSSDGGNDRTMIGLGYELNGGLSASYGVSSRTRLGAADLESQLLSINYALNKWIFSVDFGDQGVSGENEIAQLGFQYNESKPLKLYAAYTKFDNADGSSLDAFFVGARYTFSHQFM